MPEENKPSFYDLLMQTNPYVRPNKTSKFLHKLGQIVAFLLCCYFIYNGIEILHIKFNTPHFSFFEVFNLIISFLCIRLIYVKFS